MAKDKGGHGSEKRGVSAVQARNDRMFAMFDRAKAQGHTGLYSGPAHTQGVQQVGQPAPAPKFGLNSYTHEIVSPTGDVTARMRLGKSNGIAVDEGKGGGISRNSGTALHDAVAMADYRAHIGSSPSFPADRIGGELHYMTGNDFAGHTIRRIKG